MEKQMLFNKRKTFFLIVDRFWMILIGAVIGAALAVSMRVADKLVFADSDKYMSESTVYLTFAEGKLEDDQYYNGYTWGQLMSTDKILGYTMTLLDDTYERAYVEKAVTAEILADVRVMTLKVITDSMDKTNAIMNATVASLEHFPLEVDTFESITPWEIKEAVFVEPDLQLLRFAAVGAVCGLMLSFLWVWLRVLLSDSICTSEEFFTRYEIPVIALYNKDGSLAFENEAKSNFSKFLPGFPDASCKVGVVALDAQGEEIDIPVKMLRYEYSKLQSDDYRILREQGANVLIVRWGRANGNMIAHALDQLRGQDVKITAAIICGAKEGFLKRYYKIGK